MIHGEWEPTMNLRLVNPGRMLQQQWRRTTIEYREYGGKERRCEGFETRWRDVPLMEI